MDSFSSIEFNLSQDLQEVFQANEAHCNAVQCAIAEKEKELAQLRVLLLQSHTRRMELQKAYMEERNSKIDKTAS